MDLLELLLYCNCPSEFIARVTEMTFAPKTIKSKRRATRILSQSRGCARASRWLLSFSFARQQPQVLEIHFVLLLLFDSCRPFLCTVCQYQQCGKQVPGSSKPTSVSHPCVCCLCFTTTITVLLQLQHRRSLPPCFERPSTAYTLSIVWLPRRRSLLSFTSSTLHVASNPVSILFG